MPDPVEALVEESQSWVIPIRIFSVIRFQIIPLAEIVIVIDFVPQVCIVDSRVRVQIKVRSKLRLIFLRKAVFRIVGF